MLITLDEAKRIIQDGKTVFFSGDEQLLDQLPTGNWIAGTIPYFMDITGGTFSENKIFMTPAPEYTTGFDIKWYGTDTIANVTHDAFDNGFSIIIIPAFSDVHVRYAQDAPNYVDMFMKPIIGWVSGINLSNLGKITPKVFNGKTKEKSDSKAIVIHMSLPPNKIANIGIVNLFKQGDGPGIRFESEGFSIKECIIEGKRQNFAQYLRNNKIDEKLPLVANYSGANINVCFQGIKEDTVDLYGPVFKSIEYKMAGPLQDYVSQFLSAMPVGQVNPVFSCNCILNYLYSGLEGKKTGNITGPITFGEVAYQLLNQTLAYLEVLDR